MKIAEVTIHNFGSFLGPHQVRLSDRGLVFVQGENHDEPRMESNGSGKSTLFDALDWCFFGNVPKGDVAKSVVNEEAKKNCWVITHLIDGDEEFWIYRFRQVKSQNGVRVFRRASNTPVEELTSMDANVTLGTIEKILGLNRPVFHAAVYRAQWNTSEFAEATDAARKEVLTSIIPELEQCGGLQDQAKAILKEVQLKKQEHVLGKTNAENELQILESVDWASRYQTWEADRNRRLAQAQSGLQASQAQQQQYEANQANLEALKSQEEAIVIPTPQWVAEVYQRRSAVTSLKAEANELATKIAVLDSEHQKVSSRQPGSCPTCGQATYTEEMKQAELAELAPKTQELRSQFDTLTPRIQAAEAAVVEAEGYLAQEQQYSSALQAQKAQVQGQIAGLSSVQPPAPGQLEEWQKIIVATQQEQWPGAEEQQQAAARADSLREGILASTKEIEQLEHMEKHVNFWVQGLGNRGLKSYILDSRIEAMTEAANEWVQALTGGTMWVRFETQTQTGGGKLSEKLNIRVFRHNPDGTITERNFKSWSGGEKKRVSLAIDQGISKLIANRADKHWELYIIDESFRQHMDQGGREAVFELLHQLNRESIFVVDHDPQMGAQFENRMLVRIQNRKSSFPEEAEEWVTFSDADPSDPERYVPPLAGVSVEVAA